MYVYIYILYIYICIYIYTFIDLLFNVVLSSRMAYSTRIADVHWEKDGTPMLNNPILASINPGF